MVKLGVSGDGGKGITGSDEEKKKELNDEETVELPPKADEVKLDIEKHVDFPESAPPPYDNYCRPYYVSESEIMKKLDTYDEEMVVRSSKNPETVQSAFFLTKKQACIGIAVLVGLLTVTCIAFLVIRHSGKFSPPHRADNVINKDPLKSDNDIIMQSNPTRTPSSSTPGGENSDLSTEYLTPRVPPAGRFTSQSLRSGTTLKGSEAVTGFGNIHRDTPSPSYSTYMGRVNTNPHEGSRDSSTDPPMESSTGPADIEDTSEDTHLPRSTGEPRNHKTTKPIRDSSEITVSPSQTTGTEDRPRGIFLSTSTGESDRITIAIKITGSTSEGTEDHTVVTTSQQTTPEGSSHGTLSSSEEDSAGGHSGHGGHNGGDGGDDSGGHSGHGYHDGNTTGGHSGPGGHGGHHGGHGGHHGGHGGHSTGGHSGPGGHGGGDGGGYGGGGGGPGGHGGGGGGYGGGGGGYGGDGGGYGGDGDGYGGGGGGGGGGDGGYD